MHTATIVHIPMRDNAAKLSALQMSIHTGGPKHPMYNGIIRSHVSLELNNERRLEKLLFNRNATGDALHGISELYWYANVFITTLKLELFSQ